MLKTILIAASLAALSSTAVAAPRHLVTSEPVSVAQVNFADPSSVKDVYARLKRAATNVCSIYIASAHILDTDTLCVDQALASAVRNVDRPQLSALHDGDSANRLATRGASNGGLN